MAILRGIPRKQKLATYRGRLMVDTVRGVLRVRKWPKKRGTPKSALQLFWIDWFRQANLLAKYVDAKSAIRAIELSKHSGFYPRDILLKAMRGRLYTWVDETGWKWYSVAAIGDISESLDVLAQTIGSVLTRATDRWRAVAPGNVDDVLTYKGDALPAVWQPAAGGGGAIQENLAGTPIVPDGTKNLYDLDVSAYASVGYVLDRVTFALADRPAWRFSVDGGLTFKAGATDYTMLFVDHAASGRKNRSDVSYDITNSIAAFDFVMNFDNLRVTRVAWQGAGERNANRTMFVTGFPKFAGPITDIRLMSVGGQNFAGGNIFVVGSR